MIVNCEHCGKPLEKSTGHVNRARKVGMKLFCNRICFGLNRRVQRTTEQKKEIKRLYDIEYRKKNHDYVEARRKAYEKSPAGRAMQKRNREKFKQHHLEYCRTPEYKAWKKNYDKVNHAKYNYGEFWEANLILNEIETVIEPERKETKVQKGTYNKSQKRKRTWNSQQRI